MKRILALLITIGLAAPLYGRMGVPLSSWMAHMAPQIKDCALTEIFIPGSHDSAAYRMECAVGRGQRLPKGLDVITGSVGFGPVLKKWSQTQGESVLTQLKHGIRYLDLRVVYRDSKKQFYTVHSLYGPSLSDILGQVVRFVNQHPKEILVLHVGNLRHMPHGDQDHRDLITMLKTAFGEKLMTKSVGFKTPLEALWAQGKQIALIYDNSAVAAQYDFLFSGGDVTPTGEREYSANASIDSFWANKDSIAELKKSLVDHLSAYPKKKEQLYVVQSQLTHDTKTIAKSFIPFSKSFNSLRSMADAVKKELPNLLGAWSDYGPAIILLDYIDKNTGKMIVKLNENLALKQKKKVSPNLSDTATAPAVKEL